MTLVASAMTIASRAEAQVTRVSLWHVPLTSQTPYYMAEGKTCDTVETVVIAVDTNVGVTGWGEVCPIPHYLPAYARGVGPALQELAPVILGGDPVGVGALMAAVDAYLPGHGYAKSALDIALWDITGQISGLPLSALLGGRRQADLPLYHSITSVAPDEMARIAKEAQAKGITQFQAKLGASGDWQTDVARLAAVRAAVGPGPLVYGDWNCGATSLDATRVGRAVADLDVMLEQPCATLEDCARVRQATGLPMKLDELAHDTASLLAGGGTLSGGQAQKLGLARAMLRGAPVLLLDEPTSALDPESRTKVMRSLLTPAQPTSVLMITHDDAGLSGFDRVYRLEGGQLSPVKMPASGSASLNFAHHQTLKVET